MTANSSQTPRVALVTGANSGFGALIVRTLARAGVVVYAGMRDSMGRNGDAAADTLKWADFDRRSVRVVDLDVSLDESVDVAVATVLSEREHIDIVVNNAGISAMGPLEAFDIDQVRAVFDVNAFGALRVDRAVLPAMRARQSGLLVHVSSVVGRVLPGIGGPYPASKWALEGLAEGLAHQVAPFGIDVVILEPGSYPTSSVARGMKPAHPEIVAAYGSRPTGAPPMTATGSPEDPQEVADAVLAIVETPAGARPLRVVVGQRMTAGAAAYNAGYQAFRDALVESMWRASRE